MKKGVISVVLPVYKVEEYLDRCLESVVNQTYKKLEIILVDDGSPDNSGKICDQWAKKDKRIKVIHKENDGVSSARNLGIDKATGEYITFVDPDDFLDITMYEKLHKQIVQQGADICMCKYSYYYSENDIKKINEINLIQVDSDNFVQFAVNSNAWSGNEEKKVDNIMCSVWRAIFKQELIGDIRFRPLKICEDLAFYFDLLIKKPKFAVVDEYLYFYVIRENSALRTLDKNGLNNRIEFAKKIDELLDGKIEQDVIKGYKFYHFRNCAILVANSRDKELKKYFKENEFIKNFNSKENYKLKQKQVKGLKLKVINFLMHHYMFNIYNALFIIYKLIKK